jgi:predicted porin
MNTGNGAGAAIAALFAGMLLQSAAQAQTNVQLYGLIDNGIEVINHANNAGNTLLRMPSITGSLPSRFGLRGSEDLGGGAKALFVLESGFAPDSGSLNYGGRLFGRQAYVGMSSDYGTLYLGRQYTMTFYALGEADILGPNIYAMSNLDPYLPNARSDNSLGYLGKAGPFSYGASYSFGRDVGSSGGPQATNCPGELASDAQACRQATAMLKYDAARWGLAASWDNLHGGPNAAFGLVSSNFRDVRKTISGYARIGGWKLGAGWLGRQNTSAASFKSNLYFVGAVYPLTPAWQFDSQLGYLDVKDSGNDSALLALRMSYLFSKRTTAYVTTGYIRNKGAAAISVSSGGTVGAGQNQAGMMLGVRHVF